jgi:hypothetical protein
MRNTHTIIKLVNIRQSVDKKLKEILTATKRAIQ